MFHNLPVKKGSRRLRAFLILILPSLPVCGADAAAPRGHKARPIVLVYLYSPPAVCPGPGANTIHTPEGEFSFAFNLEDRSRDSIVYVEGTELRVHFLADYFGTRSRFLKTFSRALPDGLPLRGGGRMRVNSLSDFCLLPSSRNPLTGRLENSALEFRQLQSGTPFVGARAETVAYVKTGACGFRAPRGQWFRSGELRQDYLAELRQNLERHNAQIRGVEAVPQGPGRAGDADPDPGYIAVPPEQEFFFENAGEESSGPREENRGEVNFRIDLMQHFVDPLAMAHSPDGADFSGMEEEEVHFHEARLSPFDAAPLSWRPSDLEEEEGAPRVGDRPAALPLVGRWVAAGGAEAACGESPAPLSKLDSVTNHSEEHLIGAGGAAEDVSDDHSSLLANRDSEAEHSEEDLIGAGGAAEDVSDDHSSLLANRDTESEHSEEERIVDDGGEDGIGELPELIANRASESDHSEEDLSFSAQEAADESSPDDE